MSRSCTSRLSRRSRTRSKSRGSRRGRMSMSARSAAARSAKRASVVSVRTVASEPISESRWPPIRPSVSCSSMAFRSPQPSSSMSPVIAASPGRSRGSAADPIGSEHQKADERNGVLLDGPHAAGRCQASGGGFRETGMPARGRAREASSDRPPSGHRDRTSESLSASPTRPLGTTLNTTRPSGRSQSRAARCIAPGVTCR